jgi:hypothetical protein
MMVSFYYYILLFILLLLYPSYSYDSSLIRMCNMRRNSPLSLGKKANGAWRLEHPEQTYITRPFLATSNPCLGTPHPCSHVATPHRLLATTHTCLVTHRKCLSTHHRLLVTHHTCLATSHRLLATPLACLATPRRFLATSHCLLPNMHPCLATLHRLLSTPHPSNKYFVFLWFLSNMLQTHKRLLYRVKICHKDFLTKNQKTGFTAPGHGISLYNCIDS